MQNRNQKSIKSNQSRSSILSNSSVSHSELFPYDRAAKSLKCQLTDISTLPSPVVQKVGTAGAGQTTFGWTK